MSHTRIRKDSTLGSYLLPGLDYRSSKAVRARDQVFLTGATGLTIDGQQLIGEGDPASQAENAMEVGKVLIEEAGATLQDICKSTVYVTKAEYFRLVYPVIERYLGMVNPVSTGLVITELARPEIDFEIDIFAVIPENVEAKKTILTPNYTKDSETGNDSLSSAAIVRSNSLIFLSGQTGYNLSGVFVGENNPAAQADNAMKCVRHLLEEVGGQMDDICKVITYIRDVSFREATYRVLAEHMRGVKPVSTGLVVEGFDNEKIDFSIDVLAAI